MPVSIAASASSAPWLNSFVLLTLGYGFVPVIAAGLWFSFLKS
jgi:hypothetical protein